MTSVHLFSTLPTKPVPPVENKPIRYKKNTNKQTKTAGEKAPLGREKKPLPVIEVDPAIAVLQLEKFVGIIMQSLKDRKISRGALKRALKSMPGLVLSEKAVVSASACLQFVNHADMDIASVFLAELTLSMRANTKRTPPVPMSVTSLCKCITALSKFSCSPHVPREQIAAAKKYTELLTSLLQGVSAAETPPYKVIANGLLGLRKMDSDTPEVRALLAVLLPLIESGKGSSDSSNYISSLFALKEMTSGAPEVDNIVNAITSRVAASAEETQTSKQIVSSLHGLHSMSSSSPQTLKVISMLTAKILETDFVLTGQDIGSVLYGLKGMNDRVPEVRALVAALAPKMAASEGPLTGQSVGNMLYGLQSMSSNSSEVLASIEALTGKISSCTGHLSPQETANALYGLRRMRSGAAEVKHLLVALVPKISPTGKFSAQEVGNALFGLQSMRSIHAEVLPVLAALTPKVAACDEKLNAQAVSNALFGLRSMRSSVPEVYSLIQAIVPRVQSCDAPFSAKGLSMALFGLQFMSNRDPHVSELLTAITPLVAWHAPPGQSLSPGAGSEGSETGALNATEAANAIYGLRYMDSYSSELCTLLAALLPRVTGYSGPWSSLNIVKAMQGVHAMSSSHSEVRALLAVIASRLEDCEDFFSASDLSSIMTSLRNMSAGEEEVCSVLTLLEPRVLHCETFSPQDIVLLFRGLRSMKSDVPAVRRLLSVLAAKVSDCDAQFSVDHVTEVLSSLKGMNIEEQEVRFLLSVLSFKVAECDTGLSAENLSASIYGLRNMNSGSPQVRFVLSMLESKMTSSSGSGSSESWASKHISASLLGFYNMSSEQSEVRAMLAILAPKINQSGIWSAHNIGSAIFGLSNMNSDAKEVRQILTALTPKISSCVTSFGGHEIQGVLSGMKCMSSDTPEVRAVLAALGQQLADGNGDGGGSSGSSGGSSSSGSKPPTGGMTAESVSLALGGLQGMSSGSSGRPQVEVLQLLSTLSPRVVACKETLSPKELASALYGLQGMDIGCTETQPILERFRKDLLDISENIANIDALDVRRLLRVIDMLYEGFFDKNILEKLSSVVESSGDNREDVENDTKKIFLAQVRKQILANTNATVSYNTYLGNFEAMIVCRAKHPDVQGFGSGQEVSPDVIVNIELEEGSSALGNLSRKRYCYLRDNYLKEKLGIHVIRLNAADASVDNLQSLQQQLQNCLEVAFNR
jgi:hypothetical protein